MESSYRISELLSGALGTGISALLLDPEISEIRLNSKGDIWGNRLGTGKFKANISISTADARRAIYAVAYSVGAICNEDKPSISAELPVTGERFQGMLPPITPRPTFAIRKKATRIFSLSDFEEQGVIADGVRPLLEAAVLKRKNILVIGGTDSGKTTFANALLKVVATTLDHVIVIEDTQELQCAADDVDYLRTKDAVKSLRDLTRDTLRMSPERIVIGEVRGAEALDLLKAWNTGHPGGVSTVHANSAEKGLIRIEQLVQEAGVPPCKEMIAEAINVLVFMQKVGTKRIVKEIMEVQGVRKGLYELTPLIKGA